jgi:hypothetical protein
VENRLSYLLVKAAYRESKMDVPEIIRRAIKIGERNGRITFDELDQLCGSAIQAEDIERIFHALSEAGVSLEEQ